MTRLCTHWSCQNNGSQRYLDAPVVAGRGQKIGVTKAHALDDCLVHILPTIIIIIIMIIIIIIIIIINENIIL
jgi:hypothetical protein